MAASGYVCGADGCAAGWVVAWLDDSGHVGVGIAPDFRALLGMTSAASTVAVDIPIGLLNAAVPGGRECDRIARKMVGPRASSVFPPPVYSALQCVDYAAAVAANRASSKHELGISKQCFALFPRLREVHALMTPEQQQRVREVHPELCFVGLNGGKPLVHSKQTTEGLNQRLALLRAGGVRSPERSLSRFTPGTAAPDDVLDALAAAWTARRIASGEATCIPKQPEADQRSLRMEMWC